MPPAEKNKPREGFEMKKKLAIAWLSVVGMGMLWLVVAIVREALRGNREAMAMLGLGGIIVFMGITALSANVLLGRD